MINFLMVACLTLSAITVTFGAPLLYAATAKAESKSMSTFGVSKLKDAKLDSLKHKGMISVDDSNIHTVEVHGPIKMDKTTVRNGTTVFGPFNAQYCELGSVDVTGPCKLENSNVKSIKSIGPIKIDETTVAGDVNVVGPMIADEATFKKPLEITGPLRADESKFDNILIHINGSDQKSSKRSRRNRPVAVFDDSTAEEIIVKGEPQGDRPLVIVLKDGTKVKKITFKSGKGLVVADSDSSADNIVGGELKDKAKKQARKASRKKKEIKTDS